jgi:hypothetical protein
MEGLEVRLAERKQDRKKERKMGKCQQGQKSISKLEWKIEIEQSH